MHEELISISILTRQIKNIIIIIKLDLMVVKFVKASEFPKETFFKAVPVV
jgi:hypothetical protein